MRRSRDRVFGNAQLGREKARDEIYLVAWGGDDDAGHFGWNVVTGCWYVVVSAPGYASKTSALVGVPPEVTDLDLTLDAINLPNKVYLPLVRR